MENTVCRLFIVISFAGFGLDRTEVENNTFVHSRRYGQDRTLQLNTVPNLEDTYTISARRVVRIFFSRRLT